MSLRIFKFRGREATAACQAATGADRGIDLPAHGSICEYIYEMLIFDMCIFE